jgi:hypothetical protein
LPPHILEAAPPSRLGLGKVPDQQVRSSASGRPTEKPWLKRHARFHLHFTPTSGSWLNMVERFFAEITRKRIRRGVFKTRRAKGRYVIHNC